MMAWHRMATHKTNQLTSLASSVIRAQAAGSKEVPLLTLLSSSPLLSSPFLQREAVALLAFLPPFQTTKKERFRETSPHKSRMAGCATSEV